MEKPVFFDYVRIAHELEIPETQVKALEEEVKEEFPRDTMLYELHVLRALHSIKRFSRDKTA
jgi:hypothetical protein